MLQTEGAEHRIVGRIGALVRRVYEAIVYGVLRIIAQMGLAALILYSAVSCAEPPLPAQDRCLEGTTPTPDGCRAVPNWNPWERDAGRAAPDSGAAQNQPPVDASVLDGGASTGTTTPQHDGGILPEEPNDLTGTWGLRTVNVQVVDNEFVGQQVVETVVLSLVDLTHRDDQVQMTTRVCRIVSQPYGDMTTTFDEAFVAALPVDTTFATVSPNEVGEPFIPETRRRIISWSAQDPVNEPVPATADDPRVDDADQDGEIGITLHVSGALNGDLYVVQRTTIDLEGIVESWSRIVGTSQTLVERKDLGASNPILRASNTTRSPHPDAARSPFEMVRVPDSMDCAALETILDPTP